MTSMLQSELLDTKIRLYLALLHLFYFIYFIYFIYFVVYVRSPERRGISNCSRNVLNITQVYILDTISQRHV